MSPDVIVQFNQLVAAIGQAIGNASVHEAGWQMRVPSMECGVPWGAPCQGNYVYEYYTTSPNAYWNYTDVPGEQLHWSAGAADFIAKYLLGLL
jgi:hypothetical protein